MSQNEEFISESEPIEQSTVETPQSQPIQLEQIWTMLETKFAQMESRFDHMETKVDRRFEHLFSQITPLQNDIEVLSEGFRTLTNTVEENAETARNIAEEQRLTIEQQNDRISELEAKMDGAVPLQYFPAEQQEDGAQVTEAETKTSDDLRSIDPESELPHTPERVHVSIPPVTVGGTLDRNMHRMRQGDFQDESPDADDDWNGLQELADEASVETRPSSYNARASHQPDNAQRTSTRSRRRETISDAHLRVSTQQAIPISSTRMVQPPAFKLRTLELSSILRFEEKLIDYLETNKAIPVFSELLHSDVKDLVLHGLNCTVSTLNQMPAQKFLDFLSSQVIVDCKTQFIEEMTMVLEPVGVLEYDPDPAKFQAFFRGILYINKKFIAVPDEHRRSVHSIGVVVSVAGPDSRIVQNLVKN